MKFCKVCRGRRSQRYIKQSLLTIGIVYFRNKCVFPNVAFLLRFGVDSAVMLYITLMVTVTGIMVTVTGIAIHVHTVCTCIYSCMSKFSTDKFPSYILLSY